jgi:hypothetical protein
MMIYLKAALPWNTRMHRLFAVGVALWIVIFAAAVSAQQIPDKGPASKTQVVLLGTGNPFPDPDRSGSATAIVVNGSAYLVDFGAGVVRRAKAAMFDKGIAALEPTNLNVAFVTRLHSDHTIVLRPGLRPQASSPEEALKEVLSGYAGEVVVGRDLDVY